MNELTFRPMNRRDIPCIADMERVCFKTPWSERSLKEELRNSIAVYTVAELEGEIVAYGGMWIMFDEAHVTNIAVHPDHRRHGIGRRMMLEMISRAEMRGATQMTLEVRVSNTAAQEMYYALGFEVSGRRKGYYSDTGEDALILWNRNIKETH